MEVLTDLSLNICQLLAIRHRFDQEVPLTAFRLAFLGMWHVHADGLVRCVAQNTDEFQLLGGFDSDAAVAQARANAWRPLIPEWQTFDSAEAVLAAAPDGIVVKGKVWQNIELAMRAVQSGIPVLLEKPPGTRLQDFQTLQRAAQAAGVHVQVHYLFRYLPAVRALLHWRPSLGDIYQFRGRMPKDVATYAQVAEELRPYPGGIFYEMAGHLIDLMVTLMGPPLAIHASLRHVSQSPPQSYVDLGAALFDCQGGQGLVDVPAMESVSDARRIEVYGTGGAFVICNLGSGHLENTTHRQVLWRKAGDTAWTTQLVQDEPMHLRDLQEFAAVARGQKRPDYSAEHDLAVQAALLQASGM